MNVKKSEIFRAVALVLLVFAPVACMAGKCITGLACSVSALIAGRIGRECASEEVPPWFRRSTVIKTTTSNK